MIRCAVFDFDGTLVDSNEIKRSTFYEITGHIPAAAAALDSILSEPAAGDRYDIFQTLIKRVDCRGAKAEELAETYGMRCEARILGTLDVSTVTGTIDRLIAGGIAVFVNSATPESDLVRLLARTSLLHRLEGIYGRPCSKTENLRRILAEHRRLPQEVVVVGDGEDDYASALEAGCHFVAVNSGAGTFVKTKTISVSSISDLPAILARLA